MQCISIFDRRPVLVKRHVRNIENRPLKLKATTDISILTMKKGHRKFETKRKKQKFYRFAGRSLECFTGRAVATASAFSYYVLAKWALCAVIGSIISHTRTRNTNTPAIADHRLPPSRPLRLADCIGHHQHLSITSPLSAAHRTLNTQITLRAMTN